MKVTNLTRRLYFLLSSVVGVLIAVYLLMSATAMAPGLECTGIRALVSDANIGSAVLTSALVALLLALAPARTRG